MKNKNNIYNVLLRAPFVLYTILVIYLYITLGTSSLIIWIVLLWGGLLFLMGLGLSSDKKGLKLVGLIALLCLAISSFFIGANDYNRWSSTIVIINVVIYHLVLYLAKNRSIL